MDTGIGNYRKKPTSVADVTDGLSNTYLLGEKYLDPDYYETGQDAGDDDTMYWPCASSMIPAFCGRCGYSSAFRSHSR